VTPIWARVMAAKMERSGHDVLFNESSEGGHGPGSTNAAQADMWALKLHLPCPIGWVSTDDPGWAFVRLRIREINAASAGRLRRR